MNTQYIKHNNKGTTVVEMMVALSVFGIFIAMAMGGFIQAIKLQRIAVNLMEGSETASIAIENIAREVRTGRGTSFGGGSALSITELAPGTMNTPRTVTFSQSGDTIYRGTSDGASAPVATFGNKNVKVKSFSADVASDAEHKVPLITLRIDVVVEDNGKIVAENIIQTSVSPRIYNYDSI